MILQYYYRILPNRTVEVVKTSTEGEAKRKFGDGKSVVVLGPCDNYGQLMRELRDLRIKQVIRLEQKVQ